MVGTTKMSSKGQIVIPEALRRRLRLKEGTQFVVVGEGDVVILKTINAPSMDDFDDLIAEVRVQAKKAGMKRKDVAEAIKRVRSRR